ncbi:MAG: group 1 truncated hemoglobin [Pseudomonadota bacterium]
MSDSLFSKYGGFKNISRVVMTFYEMALESDEVGGFFEDIDMARLIDHQTKFIASLMGGPAAFSDERLHAVHRPLGIGHADFDAIAGLLAEALAEHGIAETDIAKVVAAVEAKRAIIVTQKAA